MRRRLFFVSTLYDHWPMIYDRFTRILHWGIAVGVLLQLVSELLMRAPRPQHTPSLVEALFFIVHEYVGFAVLILVGVRLMHFFDHPEAERQRLFPWLSRQGRRDLWLELRREVPGWLQGKLKPPQETYAVAGCVHGLGLALAFAQGLTGTILFLGTNPDGSMGAGVKFVADCHSVFGNIMWVFLIGHATMALAHQLLGHQALQRIFSLREP